MDIILGQILLFKSFTILVLYLQVWRIPSWLGFLVVSIITFESCF